VADNRRFADTVVAVVVAAVDSDTVGSAALDSEALPLNHIGHSTEYCRLNVRRSCYISWDFLL